MSVQFYGYNFGGTDVFDFFALMHSVQKLVLDFGDFQTLCVIRDSNWDCIRCKWVWTMNWPIYCKYGSSFMGLAVNAGLNITNEERQNIPHSRCSFLNRLPAHKGWPRFAMNGSIHRSHSFQFSAISITVFSNT